MDNHHDIVLAGCHHRSKGRTLSYTVLSVLCAILFFALLPSCSPRIIERVVYQHDTTVVHKRDSIFHRDSIYVKEWMKGDTVFIEKYKDRYIYRDRWRDSIRVVRDSEKPAYITGDAAMELADVVCTLGCEHCNQ